MALIPRLDLRQSQQLVMTPQLQQAIKLLQLNNIELSAFVEQELEQNPLLEREETDTPLAESVGGVDGEPTGESTTENAGEVGSEGLEAVDLAAADDRGGEGEGALDVDYENTWNNDATTDAPDEGGLGSSAFSEWGGRGGGHGFDDGEYDLEQTLSRDETLRDHLLGQMFMDLPDPVERTIGLHLLELLDEAGYVAGDLDSVAEVLGCSPEQVEAVLAKLQHFDPPGIFARNLSECLALQLRELNRLDPAMQALLDNLELLAKRDLKGLMRLCGVDAEDLTEMVGEIRSLDPKPATAFDHSVAQPVTPDVLMRAKPGGGWIIELNNDTLPRVLVNNRYYSQVSEAAREKTEKQYINECFQSANWLARSLHQRATTILKVATELVRQQDAFFLKGVQHLRPLVLRDIAEAIGMHESTVSRVTSNKYMATPRGIYELKYFFTPAIASAEGGEAHSAEAVRHRIKTMIDAEEPKAVLSDDKIVALLKADGIDIARRTVAKYREGMGIGSSVQRRREKSAQL